MIARTLSMNQISVPFLELSVKLSEREINTDVYIQDRDRHQYLHHTSSHYKHTKRSDVYS